MNKPQSLRTAIEAALPELKSNPDRLLMFIDKGDIVATDHPSICFVYHYTLNVIVTDYAAHSDTLFLPVIMWLKQHQPDILTGKVDGNFSFIADAISNDATDISIDLKLQETVMVKTENGTHTATHIDEPTFPEVWPFNIDAPSNEPPV